MTTAPSAETKTQLPPLPDLVRKNIRKIDAATEAARFLSEHGGTVGFCDNPDDLAETEGVELRTIAIITGRKSKIPVGKGKKPARGSALIVERSLPNGTSDFQIVPNDSKDRDARYRFTIDSARKVFPSLIHEQLLNAIHVNLEHRRQGILPKQGTVYQRKSS